MSIQSYQKRICPWSNTINKGIPFINTKQGYKYNPYFHILEQNLNIPMSIIDIINYYSESMIKIQYKNQFNLNHLVCSGCKLPLSNNDQTNKDFSLFLQQNIQNVQHMNLCRDKKIQYKGIIGHRMNDKQRIWLGEWFFYSDVSIKLLNKLWSHSCFKPFYNSTQRKEYIKQKYKTTKHDYMILSLSGTEINCLSTTSFNTKRLIIHIRYRIFKNMIYMLYVKNNNSRLSDRKYRIDDFLSYISSTDNECTICLESYININKKQNNQMKMLNCCTKPICSLCFIKNNMKCPFCRTRNTFIISAPCLNQTETSKVDYYCSTE